MSKIKYYYDTETCKYVRARTSKSEIALNFTGIFLFALVLAFTLVWVYNNFFGSPVEQALRRENDELKFYYKLLNKEMSELDIELKSLEDRDKAVYRSIFEKEHIDENVLHSGIGNMEAYKNYINEKELNNKLILNTLYKIEKLKKEMYVQSISYNELSKLAGEKQKMLASIPAIQPTNNPDLKKLVSGFGYRIHPIYKVRMFHSGVDFSVKRGTPIYATGDGEIKTVANNPGGYGKEIEIDHGFGYITKYAHLDKFAVKKGQKVKRGELIGYSGATGTATAPHLHYEIIHNGNKVNPVHYFFKDLNPDQYKVILELAQQENQPLS